MKEFIKENWVWLIVIVIGLGFLLFIESTREMRKVGGVIYEHIVNARQTGRYKYVTIIKTDDGYIEEETGLELYTTPVGSRVYIEVVRSKK
jgi:hypothetical protein